MRKSRLLFVALFAMFTFGVLTAESAVAAPTFLLALWLWKGANVTEPLNVEAEGELLLEDIKGGLFGEAIGVLCSGILEGTVNPESLDYISEVLTLTPAPPNGELISTEPLVELGLECKDKEPGDGGECPSSLVWAVGLPWETEVELMEENGATFFVILVLPHAGGKLGWLVQCMGTFSEPEDECTATEGVAVLSLEGSTLLAGFKEEIRELAEAPLATCTRGGAAAGLVQSDEPFGPLRHEAGGELSASSEGIEA